MLVLLPSSSSKLLAKWQGPFVVTRRVGDVDYEVVRSDRGGATQIYHLSLLKDWREAEPVSLVTMVTERHELGPEVLRSTAHPKKCAVGWGEVRYLGYHLGGRQVRPQVDKTAAMVACSRPRPKKR